MYPELYTSISHLTWWSGQLHPITPALANPLVNSLDVHFDLSKTLLRWLATVIVITMKLIIRHEDDFPYDYSKSEDKLSSKYSLSRAQSLNAGEGYIFKNLEKDGDISLQMYRY